MSHVLDEKKTIPAIASLCSYIAEFANALRGTRIDYGTIPRSFLDLFAASDPYLEEEYQILLEWLIATSVDAVDPKDRTDPSVLPGYRGSHQKPHTWAEDITPPKAHAINSAFAIKWPGPVNFWMRGDSLDFPFPQFGNTGLAASAWLLSSKKSRVRKVVSHRV